MIDILSNMDTLAQITIPPTLGESATSSGYLEINGRCVEKEGFTVYITSLIGVTCGRVHILTNEAWQKYELLLKFNGIEWVSTIEKLTYSAEILLQPGRYTARPKN